MAKITKKEAKECLQCLYNDISTQADNRGQAWDVMDVHNWDSMLAMVERVATHLNMRIK